MDNRELYKIALENLKYSYSPYSNFPVSAVLLTSKGNLYLGVNIENASYGLTICAERVAIFKAVSQGEKNFEKIIIVGKDGNGIPPCGACRQVIMEFSPEMEIVLFNSKENKFLIYKAKELLPSTFKLEVNDK